MYVCEQWVLAFVAHNANNTRCLWEQQSFLNVGGVPWHMNLQRASNTSFFPNHKILHFCPFEHIGHTLCIQPLQLSPYPSSNSQSSNSNLCAWKCLERMLKGILGFAVVVCARFGKYFHRLLLHCPLFLHNVPTLQFWETHMQPLSCEPINCSTI